MKPLNYAENWNRDHAVGTRVKYWLGKREGEGHISRTSSEAFVVGGHSAVVMIEGVSGCVAISHVKPIAESEVAA